MVKADAVVVKKNVENMVLYKNSSILNYKW
jgi:hypothetical protein